MRLLCVATAKNHAAIVAELTRLAGDEIEHLVSFGSTAADYKSSSLLRMTRAEGQRGHFMDGDRFTGAGAVLRNSPDYAAVVLEAVDTLQRASDGHLYRPHGLRHADEFVHYINIVADRLAHLLIEERIDRLLFFDVPHLFSDSLIYRVARLMGIETLILRVCPWPGRFFSMRQVEHFGHLRADLAEVASRQITWAEPLDLAYMAGIKQGEAEVGRLTSRALGHLAMHVIRREPSLLLKPAKLASHIRRMRAAAAKLPAWRDPFARFFHPDALDYAEKLVEFEAETPDLNRRFVYFAMHLQPEMTTGILGGRYRDQALALEQLAEMLPDDVLIYAKENPKQGGPYRGSMFFHRLARIGKLRMMPSHLSTYELIQASEWVATISGTVAWEAITYRKPALIFGESWMQDMPGVRRYQKDLRYREMAEATVEDAALEAEYGRLFAASHPGFIVRHEARRDEGHDAEANATEVASQVLDLLQGRAPLSFEAASEEIENTLIR